VKAKWMILVLAGAWVLWTNKYYEWRPFEEYETLAACNYARATQNAQLNAEVLAEAKSMGFIKRLFSRPLTNPNGEFKCMPAGTVPR
jgi:hypothetical protein